ncbi:MAG: hypothetical protein LCH46_09835 [Proteobacteria bacterium]|nr:hypothetical protein [Pseudomonadota bacterium]
MEPADIPTHPYKILAAALLVPGAGHVWLGLAQRGLMFLFFTAVLGWVSAKLMPADATFIGRHIGGVFIYGVSVIDAYRTARLRYELWRHKADTPVQP